MSRIWSRGGTCVGPDVGRRARGAPREEFPGAGGTHDDLGVLGADARLLARRQEPLALRDELLELAHGEVLLVVLDHKRLVDGRAVVLDARPRDEEPHRRPPRRAAPRAGRCGAGCRWAATATARQLKIAFSKRKAEVAAWTVVVRPGRLRKRTHVTTVSHRNDVPGVQRGYRRHLLRPERSPTGGTGRAGQMGATVATHARCLASAPLKQ